MFDMTQMHTMHTFEADLLIDCFIDHYRRVVLIESINCLHVARIHVNMALTIWCKFGKLPLAGGLIDHVLWTNANSQQEARDSIFEDR